MAPHLRCKQQLFLWRTKNSSKCCYANFCFLMMLAPFLILALLQLPVKLLLTVRVSTQTLPDLVKSQTKTLPTGKPVSTSEGDDDVLALWRQSRLAKTAAV